MSAMKADIWDIRWTWAGGHIYQDSKRGRAWTPTHGEPAQPRSTSPDTYERKKEIPLVWALAILDVHHWHLNQILPAMVGNRKQSTLCGYMSSKSVSFTPKFWKGWSLPYWTIQWNLRNCIQQLEKTHSFQVHITHNVVLISSILCISEIPSFLVYARERENPSLL